MVNSGKLTAEEFAEFIRSVAGEGIQAAGDHMCIIPIALKTELVHITETVKALGDGEVGKGVERIKKNHEYVMTLRRIRDKIGNIVMTAVIMAFCGGVLYVFKDFFKGAWK